jgi:PAS domain S-box-containing protein
MAAAGATDRLESGDELYALLMLVPAAVTVRRGPELRCVFQNAASLALIDQRGKTPREAWPDGISQWFDDLAHVAKTGESLVDRGVGMTREWRPGEPPTTRYWDISFAPWRLPDGRIDGVVTVLFDVTERVTALQRAEIADTRRRLALDAADVGTWRVDLVTRLDTRDAALNRILGLPEVETTQPMDDFVSRVHADDRPRVNAAIENAIAQNTDYSVEMRMVRPDGGVRWVRDIGRVVRDERNMPIAFTGAAADITDRKLAESRSDQLAEAALAASRAKDEFMAMLSHELRNPLAPIVTALQIMKLRNDPSTKEREMIERQVAHLIRLVDDLLDISRVTRGMIELTREHLPVRDVISKAIEIASPLIEQKQHHIKVDVPSGLWVDGDAVRLAQVFANLLTNAARYTNPGGAIEVAASAEHGRILVRVSDNGTGISAQMLPRVFDLFVQGGDRGRARSEGGLGIGLALVRNLLALHGATVSAHSDGKGRGSSFTVELEAVDPELAQASADALPARLPTTGRRVLVVDDNADAASLLHDALRIFGHDVAVAHDGPQALSLIGKFRPQAAVLDIGLPVMDGYELARQMRANGLTQCIFVALTGYGQEEDRARSAEAGFAAHLVKPVDLERLAKVLEDPPLAPD